MTFSVPLFMLEKAWESYVRCYEANDTEYAARFLAHVNRWHIEHLIVEYGT